MQPVGFITAKYHQQSLPGIPLQKIFGKNIVQQVWETMGKSTLLRRIVVVTDDDSVADFCMDIGAEFVVLQKGIEGEIEMIYAAMEMLGEDEDSVFFIPDREVFVRAEMIDFLIENFYKHKADAATLTAPLASKDELIKKNIYKVKIDKDGMVSGYQRSIKNGGKLDKQRLETDNIYKNIGAYIFKKDSLYKLYDILKNDCSGRERIEFNLMPENDFKIIAFPCRERILSIGSMEDVRKINEKYS